MTLSELIRETAVLGYALGLGLIALGLIVTALALLSRRDDATFTSIDVANEAPPPPRTSPFANPRRARRASLRRGGGGQT